MEEFSYWQKHTGHQAMFVTGTGTDVGKTFVTAGLLRALLKAGINGVAWKVVQTGAADGAGLDARVYASAIRDIDSDKGRFATLEQFGFPASPHLAARLEGRQINAQVLANTIKNRLKKGRFHLLEGAGGLFVPLNGRQCMLDLVQALNIPVLLICANMLGAINYGRLSLEALENHGIDLAGVVINDVQAPANDDEKMILDDNEAYLKKIVAAPIVRLRHYAGLNPASWDDMATALAPLLGAATQKTSGKGDELVIKDHRLLWHPYASACTPPALVTARRSHHNKIVLANGEELIDGMSSWWACIHGYNHPALLRALRKQAAIMPHVMFGGITHEPAVELAQRLLEVMPAGLERIFFADSGSVAVEVAMKMALQYHMGAGNRKLFLAPAGGYHGDTMGAMSVCDPINGMHTLFEGVLARQVFLGRPQCAFDRTFDPASLEEARKIFERLGDKIAAVILEPIVQGAGGMWFYHPSYLSGLADMCREYGALLILDEIATGFGRTGKYFAAEWANIQPDILCCGKALTGGVMTLAAVGCTGEVARGICREGRVFMHGPTFMANPLACSVAAASLDLLTENMWSCQVARIEKALKKGLAACQGIPGVKDVRALGAIGVVEMAERVNTEDLQKFFVKKGIWLRAFNNLIYTMPPYITEERDLEKICCAIYEAVSERKWRI